MKVGVPLVNCGCLIPTRTAANELRFCDQGTICVVVAPSVTAFVTLRSVHKTKALLALFGCE